MPLVMGTLAVILLVLGGLILLIINIAKNSPEETGQLRITLYSPDGTAIRTWESIKYADSSKNRVSFTDPETKQKVVLRGTIVIEDSDFTWVVPKRATHTVSLYGLSDKPIRQWAAAALEGNYDGESEFYDMLTKRVVTVFGTTVCESLAVS